jgi:spermidine/putrescine transport system substrate-binding protein
VLSATILQYFFIVNFLIDTSPESKKIRNIKERKLSKHILRNLLVIGIIFFIFIGGILVVRYTSFEDRFEKLSPTLTLYNWEEYIPEEVLQDFEDQYHVNVILYEYTDETEMMSNIINNPGGYDLLITSDNDIRDLIEMGLLQKIKKEDIPNFKYIDSSCRSSFSFDLNNDYSVPYQWGTTAFAFNMKYMPEDTDSWEIFWNENYKGKVALFDNPPEVIGVTSIYLGLPLVPQSNSDFIKLRKYLLMQKDVVKGYMSYIDLEDELVSEELWAGQIYDLDARVLQEENPNLRYVIPKEGAIIWMDSFIIPKNSRNKRTAEAFINFVLEPEESAKIITEYKSTSCNKASWSLVSEDLEKMNKENSNEKNFKLLDYISNYNQNKEIKEAMMDLWRELTEDES